MAEEYGTGFGRVRCREHHPHSGRQDTATLSHPFTTVMYMSSGRWQVEQVLALAPRPSSVSAAQPLAVPARWSSSGCDSRLVWGRCTGTSAEPYECAVDHVDVAFRCSCPSRVLPCKHALALLLLWAKGQVAEGQAPAYASSWVAKRLATAQGPGAAQQPATPQPQQQDPDSVPEVPPALLPPIEPNK